MDRIVYRVIWDRRLARWLLYMKGLSERDDGVICDYSTKGKAIRDGARTARLVNGPPYLRPTQLVVHNKNMRVSFERTYGHDPKRHKG